MFKTLGNVIVTPALVIAASALLLRGLNAVPAYLPGSAPAVREYVSIEAASTSLGFNISAPVYFPNYLAWPPEGISGQTKPFPKVTLTFLSADREKQELLICEWLSASPEMFSPLPWIERESARMPITLNKSQGELIIGRDAGGAMTYGAHWIINHQHYLVITKQPVEELLAIARSMTP